jgi:hypothetical protein
MTVAAFPIPNPIPCNPTDPTQWGKCLGGVAKSAASDVFSSIASAFAKAADSTINWLWAQMTTATAIHLGGSAFHQLFALAAVVAAVVAVGIFVIQLSVSALRRDPGGLSRSFIGLGVMALGAGAAVAVTELLLTAVDALSAGVLQVATGDTTQQFGNAILAGGSISGSTNNPAGLILISLLALGASVMVWLALTVRKLLVIVAAILAPFAFAGSLADFSRSWVRRWVELVAALVFSKLLLIFVFVIGWYVLLRGVGSTGTGATQGITQVVCGILILTLAGFAPWMAIKMAHFAGHHLEAVHHQVAGATAGASQVHSMARPLGSALMPAGAMSGGAVALAATSKAWAPQTPGNTSGVRPAPSAPDGGAANPAPSAGSPSANGHTAPNSNPASPPNGSAAGDTAGASNGSPPSNGAVSNGSGPTPQRATSGWWDVVTSTPTASSAAQPSADDLTADMPRSGWWDTPTSPPAPIRPINPKGERQP